MVDRLFAVREVMMLILCVVSVAACCTLRMVFGWTPHESDAWIEHSPWSDGYCLQFWVLKLQCHRECMRRSPGCCKTFEFTVAFYLLLLCMGLSFSGDDANTAQARCEPQARCSRTVSLLLSDPLIHSSRPPVRRAVLVLCLCSHSLLVLLRHVPCICTLLISFGLSQRKPVDDSLSDCVLRRIKHVLSCWFDFVMTWPRRCSHV